MTTFSPSRQMLAPPAAVFAAIREGDPLATWWGPAGFSNRFEAFEFRPAGRWAFTMVGPDGHEYPNESAFSEIEVDRRVLIDHVCAPFFRLTITLEPTAEGTLVRWDQAFADAAVAQSIRHIVEPSNEQNLDRLAAVLQKY